MLFAAKTAGLNVLRLMNDTSAIALAYGIYKQVILQQELLNYSQLFRK